MNIVIWLTSKEADCFNFNENNLIKLKRIFPDYSIINCRTVEEFKDNLNIADIVLVWIFKQEWFTIAPNLKIIATPAAGKDYFNVNLPDGVIKVHGSYHGIIIAETVIAMMLSICRGIILSFSLQSSNNWPRKEISPFMDTLRGKNLLIIGFGSIGSHIAKLAKAFGMKITGLKRQITGCPEYFDKNDRIITIDSLKEYIKEADHIVLALPSDTGTDNIINKDILKLMKKTACIYNVGRGNSINEEDLAYFLNNNLIKAAFLDVFKTEPLQPDSIIRKTKNIYIMPHASAVDPLYMDYFIDDFYEKYKIYMKTSE